MKQEYHHRSHNNIQTLRLQSTPVYVYVYTTLYTYKRMAVLREEVRAIINSTPQLFVLTGYHFAQFYRPL